MQDQSNSIDDMKALLEGRGGIARGNRFGVHINHPLRGQNLMMDVVNDKSSKKDIDTSFIQGPRDTYLMCTAVSLPGKRISTTEAMHNHNLAKKPYSMATDEVTMTFMLTQDYYIKKYFDLWQEQIINSTHNHYKTSYKLDYCVDVEIFALNSQDDAVGYGTKLEMAYPIQVSQIELGEEQEGLMSLSVTWEYDNWRMMHINDAFAPKKQPKKADRSDGSEARAAQARKAAAEQKAKAERLQRAKTHRISKANELARRKLGAANI